MQINKTAQTSFQGGFRFPQMPTVARNELENFITTKKQIFDNFCRNGDVFLVTRDKTNFKVAEFIHKHNLNFEFYPTINTKCELDAEKPEGLVALLAKTKEKPITTKTQLRKSLTYQKKKEYLEVASPKYTDKILNAIRISNKDSVEHIKGAIVVTDKEFQKKVYISPPSKLNIHYVRIQPSSMDNIVERYAIDSEGNILARYQTPNAILEFNKRFNNLLVK